LSTIVAAFGASFRLKVSPHLGRSAVMKRKINTRKLGRFIVKYGAVTLAGARLIYDVLVRTDVLR
jgi:hypothetical protein